MRTRTRTRTYACTCTYMATCTCTYANISTNAYTWTHARAHNSACMHSDTHNLVHTHKCTHTRTYPLTNTQALALTNMRPHNLYRHRKLAGAVCSVSQCKQNSHFRAAYVLTKKSLRTLDGMLLRCTNLLNIIHCMDKRTIVASRALQAAN